MCDLSVLSVFCKMHKSHSQTVLIDKLGSKASHSCIYKVESLKLSQKGVLVLVLFCFVSLALEPRLR